MKHVFLTPNAISNIVAHEIIVLRGLNQNDCVVLQTRRYRNGGSPIAHVDFPFNHLSFGTTWRLWEARGMLNRFDEWIDQSIAGDFHVYLPHSRLSVYQALQSHRRCQGFSYLEEGFAAYYDLAELRTKYPNPEPPPYIRGIKRASYGGRLTVVDGAFLDGYTRTYGTCEEAFPWSRSKTTLYPSFQQNPGPPALDGVVALAPRYQHMWDARRVADSLGSLTRWARQHGIRRVGIKPHPALGTSTALFRDAFALLSKSQLDVMIVPDDFSLESYLSYKESLLITMGSSIDWYSLRLPGGLVSLLAFSQSFDHMVEEYVSRVPAVQRPGLRRLCVDSKRHVEDPARGGAMKGMDRGENGTGCMLVP